MPDNLPQQVDVQLPPETSSVVVAKVVYGLHALSIIIGAESWNVKELKKITLKKNFRKLPSWIRLSQKQKKTL